MKYPLIIGLLSGLALLSSCSMYSHTNVEITTEGPTTSKAAYDIHQPRGQSEKTLVILALSGGGSRAAYWSSNVMLALEKVFKDQGWNLLHEVDAISSVSGGSLPAAYYAISADTQKEAEQLPSKRIWNQEAVRKLMRRNYRNKWIGNWFWPTNIAKYWFTAYDRSDIMAQTLADNLFDQSFWGWDLRFRDINPERPNLIINATNGTADHFGDLFPFTTSQFQILGSDLAHYKIARAVMASASFPGAFNYMTLKDHKQKHHYFHIFDGGNYDNLGLFSAMNILASNHQQFDRFVVILVDAYISGEGVKHADYDGRNILGFGVDLNFLDSFDALLLVNRRHVLKIFSDYMRNTFGPKGIFYPISFEDIGDPSLRQHLQSINTDFKITREDANAIDRATEKLMVQGNSCLQQIKHLLEAKDNTNDSRCHWKSPVPSTEIEHK